MGSMIEALFTYLLTHGRIPLHLPTSSQPSPSKRSRHSPTPIADQLRLALAHARGFGGSDDDLWEAWRFFARNRGDFVWLTGMSDYDSPLLDGARGFIVSFHADAALIGVKVAAGETLLLPGRNLAWCPPVPVVADVAAILEKLLDPEAARRVCQEISCRRCGLACEIGGRCCVPHPAAEMMLLEGEGYPAWCLCEACGGHLWVGKVYKWGLIDPAPGKCWEGAHSTAMLPWLDRRRENIHDACDADAAVTYEHCANGICGRHLTLTAPLLRQKIDELHTDTWFENEYVEMSDIVVRLVISEGDGQIRNLLHTGAERVRLDGALSNLEELYITDSTLAGVVVKLDVFPALEKLVSYCPRTVCTSTSSSLKSLHIYSWQGLENDMKELLKGLPSLEELEIYRFDGRDLVIASQSLRHLVISPLADRSLNLGHLGISPLTFRGLTLWTPNLMLLDLARGGDWEERDVLQKLIWLESHPLEKDLPDVHLPPPLYVCIEYSGDKQRSAVRAGLLGHPDVTYYSKRGAASSVHGWRS